MLRAQKASRMRYLSLSFLTIAIGLVCAACGGDRGVARLSPTIGDAGISVNGAGQGIHPVTLLPGGAFTATYYVNNGNSRQEKVRLSLLISGLGKTIPDRVRDTDCSVPAQATAYPCARTFVVPSNAAPGQYELEMELWSGGAELLKSRRYDAITRRGWLTVTGGNERLTAIAERYAPAFHAARRDYAPMPIEIMLDHASIRLSRETGPEAQHPSAAQLADARWNKTTAFLDVPEIEPKGNRILDHGRARDAYNDILRENKGRYPVTVYARMGAKDGKFFIQYWLFYFFNDYYNDHEGDWEWVQITFGTDDLAAIASGTPPSEAIYSRHGSGGARTWAQVAKQGSAPVVYVGAGSHANYFDDEDERQDPKGSREEDETFDDRIFTPDKYVVALLDESAAWLEFQGMWGEESRPTGFSGPRGPKWQGLENGNRDPWNDPLGWHRAAR